MSEIEAIMTTDIRTVERNAPIHEVIETMVENDVTGLPVVDDDMNLVGIISEKDVLELVSDLQNSSSTVEDFMTKEVVCFDVEDGLIPICECLIKNHFRRVPITIGGKLVGIISRKDIIKYILEPIG
jgi:CBS domain-containing protein